MSGRFPAAHSAVDPGDLTFLEAWMRRVVFRCPMTERNTEWMDCEGERQDRGKPVYQAIVCPVCARLHFLNSSTGELLGDD